VRQIKYYNNNNKNKIFIIINYISRIPKYKYIVSMDGMRSFNNNKGNFIIQFTI